MIIYFRTADSIPPPYSNEVTIDAQFDDADQIKIHFKQTYLDRDDLDEEEITEEGFTLDDDVTFEGTLNTAWKDAFTLLAEKIKPCKEVNSAIHDATFIEIEQTKFSPSNADFFKRFIEQLQQAIFEIHGRESALNIEIRQISANNERSTKLEASFARRSYQQVINNQPVTQHWNQLDEHLKLLFSGDYYYEKATNKPPKRHGIFVNLGNEWWFEVGKSLLVSPEKIAGFLV